MHGYPITERFCMHWGDMDALGHANNTRYFLWFETARIAYFRAIGLIADTPSAMGPILATASCDFLKAAVYPVDLIVGARVPRVGNTSFGMEYAVADDEDPDQPFATGKAVVVLVNYETMAKVKVPDEMRAIIEGLEGRNPG